MGGEGEWREGGGGRREAQIGRNELIFRQNR